MNKFSASQGQCKPSNLSVFLTEGLAWELSGIEHLLRDAKTAQQPAAFRGAVPSFVFGRVGGGGVCLGFEGLVFRVLLFQFLWLTTLVGLHGHCSHEP